MALINCYECNSEISDKATKCPKCGAIPKRKMTSIEKYLGIPLVVLFIAVPILTLTLENNETPNDINVSINNDQPQPIAITNQQPPETPEEIVDYSQPLYTSDYSIVCPIDILFSKKQGIGLEAAENAALSIFDRSENIEKAGCQEWKAGIRIYIKEENKNKRWQEFSEHQEGFGTNFILGIFVTNKPN